jgi:hypothetical protein
MSCNGYEALSVIGTMIPCTLLGSSAEDLFFSNNFLIVEGATDQIIAEKIMELKGIGRTKIKVVSASGILIILCAPVRRG